MKKFSFLALFVAILLGLAVGCPGNNTKVTPPVLSDGAEYPPVDAGMQTQRSGGGAPVPTVSKEAGGELID